MTKADKESIASIILFFYFIYKGSGIKGVINAIRNIAITAWKYTKFLNFTSIQIKGDSILVALFATSLEYAIVGLLFKMFKIEKGLFGKFIGNLSFYLVSFLVTFILNFLAIETLKI